MDRYDIILSGLLHDIGKFFEKANSTKGNKICGIEVSEKHHGVTSSNFIVKFQDKIYNAGFDVEAVKEMVQRHHECKGGGPASVEEAQIRYRPYCYIIDKADNLSSSERLNTRASDGSWQIRQLTNIFSLVAGQRYSQEAGLYAKVYNKVSSGSSLNSWNTNREMIEDFVDEFENISVEGKQQFISEVDKILKKYTWCYPSDTKEYIRDISLYSHLQTTAAIAGILYNDLTENPEYSNGLSYDKRSVGWKFTEVSIKQLRTQNIVLMKVNLANAIEILASSDISKIQEVKTWLVKQHKDLEGLLISKLGIASVNVLCSDDYSMVLMLNNRLATKANEIIKEFNNGITQVTGRPMVFFESSNCKVLIDELATNNTGETLEILSKSINSQCSNKERGIEYKGLSSLLLKEDRKWGSMELGKVDTIENIAGSVELGIKQSEIKNKLKNKALSLVKIRIDNYEELIHKTLGMTFNDTKGIITDDHGDKKIGTLCRLGTMLEQVNMVLNIKLDVNDCVYLYSGQDGIMFLTYIKNAFKYARMHRDIIKTQTINQLKTSIFIETVYSKNIENALRSISSRDSGDGIIYNGNRIGDELFIKLEKLLNMVIESGELSGGKSNLYKIYEFTSMYEMYFKTGKTSYLLGIPRFNYHAKRNLNKTNIKDEFRVYLENKFGRLSKEEAIEKDIEIIVLRHIIYDAIQLLKTQTEGE